MPIHFCPNCNQRYTVGFDCTDYVHNCSENVEATDAVKNEDVVIVGNWEDYSGEEEVAPQEVLRQGGENELQGTRAGIEGYKKDALTRRGVRAKTHRQRQHHHFIDLKKGGNN